MRTVALGTGTYTKVQDGYQSEYTLPDSSDALALDGYGNVTGTTKTYVVNGSNITIYDGESSVTYGIDVANHAFLGKSKFAGMTFINTGSKTIRFEDSSSYSGRVLCGSTYWYFDFENGSLDGSALTVTVSAQSGNVASVGKTVTFEVINNADGSISLKITACPASTGIDGSPVKGDTYTYSA